MTDVSCQLQALLWAHGNDFWAAVHNLTSDVGFCDCGRPGRSRQVGPAVFACCDLCNKAWWLGPQSYDWQTKWDSEAAEVWRANQEYLKRCEIISARWLCVVMDGRGGALETFEEIEGFMDALVALRLQQPEARDKVIAQVVESQMKGLK